MLVCVFVFFPFSPLYICIYFVSVVLDNSCFPYSISLRRLIFFFWHARPARLYPRVQYSRVITCIYFFYLSVEWHVKCNFLLLICKKKHSNASRHPRRWKFGQYSEFNSVATRGSLGKKTYGMSMGWKADREEKKKQAIKYYT